MCWHTAEAEAEAKAGGPLRGQPALHGEAWLQTNRHRDIYLQGKVNDFWALMRLKFLLIHRKKKSYLKILHYL